VTELRATRTANELELQKLELPLTKSGGRISELEDELSGIAIRREATGEHLKDLDAPSPKRGRPATRLKRSLPRRARFPRGRKKASTFFSPRRAKLSRIEQDRQLLAGAEKSLIALERALAEKESRLDVLKQLNEEGEGLAQGSQAVLKGLDNPKRFQPAVVGALVAKLDVDPKFAVAIEAALAGVCKRSFYKMRNDSRESWLALTGRNLVKLRSLCRDSAIRWPRQNGKFFPTAPWLGQSTRSMPQKRFNRSFVNCYATLRSLRISIKRCAAKRLRRIWPRLHWRGNSFPLGESFSAAAGSAQNESLLERQIAHLNADVRILRLSTQRDVLRQKRMRRKRRRKKAAHDLERIPRQTPSG